MGNIFSPKTKVVENDGLNKGFLAIAKYIFITIFGFLPLLFIPNSFLALDYNKTFLAFSAVFVVFILLSLVVLRTGKVKLNLPLPICLFWSFTAWALISALLSKDKQDAIFGNFLEVQTVGFFILLASLLTLLFKLAKSKKFIVQFLSVLSLSLVLLLSWQTLRIFLGADFLSLGILENKTESVVGNLNNLAVIAGLVSIVCMTLLRDIGRGTSGKIIITLVLLLALFILSVINFPLVWFLVGIFNLFFLIFSLLKGTWINKNKLERVSKLTLVLSFLVTLLAFIFLFGGSKYSNFLSEKFNVNYSEITLNTESSAEILQATYQENILFGIGPNRFEDAWRLYKNPAVNLTSFWNVDFLTGSSFVLTLLVTTGIVGGGLFFGFLLGFLKVGLEVLFLKKEDKDSLREARVIVFIAAFYLWLTTFLFNPNSTLLLLTILMTGLFLALAKNFPKDKNNILEIDVSKQGRLVPVFLIGFLFILALTSWFFVNISKQYLAENSYGKALFVWQKTGDFKETDELLAKANNLFASDLFVAERAKLRLSSLNDLLVKNPEELVEGEINKMQNYLIEGIELGNEAVLLDKTNPYNYLLLINFYRILGTDNNDEVQDLVKTALTEIESLDPTNIEYKILSAKLSISINDYEEARNILEKAVDLKSNHTEIYRLLAQVAIKAENIDQTIFEIQELLKTEIKNPARYLELGILLSELGKNEEAISAFLQALELDPYYADARYFLALVYLKLDKKAEALNHLYKAKETNQDNQELLQLITTIENTL